MLNGSCQETLVSTTSKTCRCIFFTFFQDMGHGCIFSGYVCGGICLTFFKISSHYLQLFCFTQHNSSITTSSPLSIFYLLFSPDLVFLLDLLFSLDLVLSLICCFYKFQWALTTKQTNKHFS